jgi:hypothetical protein
MPTPIPQEEYWQGTQKFTFTPEGGAEYTCINNPTLYEPTPATEAELQVPAMLGANMLNGGIEFAPIALPIEWEEMDWSEYQYLAGTCHMQFCKMIDHEDQGYWGWLRLGKFSWIPGIAAKKGKCSAVFMVSQPADGLNSLINVLAKPAGAATSSATGGAIAASTMLYYWLTFFTPWGESVPYAFNITTPSAAGTYYNLITWTAPTSGFFRKARLYVSTQANPATAYVKGDILAAESQQWTDYSGVNGLQNISTIPTVNRAATGIWGGGTWINLS